MLVREARGASLGQVEGCKVDRGANSDIAVKLHSRSQHRECACFDPFLENCKGRKAEVAE